MPLGVYDITIVLEHALNIETAHLLGNIAANASSSKI